MTTVEEFWKSFDVLTHLKLNSRSSGKKFLYFLGAAFGAATVVGLITSYYRRKPVKSTSSDDSRNNNSSGCNCQCHATRPRSLARTDSRSNGMIRSNSYHRVHQTSSISSDILSVIPGPSSPNEATERAYLQIGYRYMMDAIANWERAVNFGKFHRPDDTVMLAGLEKILEEAHALHEGFEQFLLEHCPDVDDILSVTKTLTQEDLVSAIGGPQSISAMNFGGHRTMSILSDDSFMSAFEDLVPTFSDVDVMLREPLKLPISELHVYRDALVFHKINAVPARNVRSSMLNCANDEEFFAKLHCVRKAFQNLLMDEENRDWMVKQGRTIIGDLMKTAKKDTTGFYAAYDRLIEYVQDSNQWPEIEEELKKRKVPMFTFYDVVMDFILMDAFDDLARPPSSVVAVAQNRFLSASFKESTLATVVWSVLKAKRSRLQKADGFISHFYDVSEQVSPTMAWGFLGTDERLRELCYYFKEQVCSALTDIFSFERVRFTTLEELSDDVWHIIKYRAEMTHNRICSESM